MGTKNSSRNDPATREILDSLRRIVRYARVSAATTQSELGISAAQLFVLQALADGGSLSVNEVADRVQTDQSSASVVIKRLVQKRLVVRRRSDHDGRRVELAPTAKGRALAARDVRAPGEGLLRGVERMSAASRRRLSASLRELVDAAALGDQPAAMLFDEDTVRARRPR
jgi:MarR family transcriptional regulator, lower aerobic nicotinate degradation pathway regulator